MTWPASASACAAWSNVNIVPGECRFDFEMRALPAGDPRQVAAELQAYAEHELLPRMRAVSAASDIRFSELSSYPGLLTDPSSDAARAKTSAPSPSAPKAACSTPPASPPSS